MTDNNLEQSSLFLLPFLLFLLPHEERIAHQTHRVLHFILPYFLLLVLHQAASHGLHRREYLMLGEFIFYSLDFIHSFLVLVDSFVLL